MNVAGWVLTLIVLIVIAAAIFGYRRRRILIIRGAIAMSVHRGRGLRGGWVLGVARYSDEYLEWFRMTSFRAGPSLRIGRRETTIEERAEATAADADWMPPEPIVLRLSTPGGPQLVAVSKSSMPGLLSWWESAPPRWLERR